MILHPALHSSSTIVDKITTSSSHKNKTLVSKQRQKQQDSFTTIVLSFQSTIMRFFAALHHNCTNNNKSNPLFLLFLASSLILFTPTAAVLSSDETRETIGLKELAKIPAAALVPIQQYGLIDEFSSYVMGNFVYQIEGFFGYNIPNCTSQSFGSDGAYTNFICKTFDDLKAICDEEPGCDSSKTPPPFAGKGSFLSDSDKVSTLAFHLFLDDCASTKGGDFLYCINLGKSFIGSNAPSYITLEQQVQQLQGLVSSFVPNGANNFLMSNFLGTLVSAGYNQDQLPQNFIVGDGYLEITSTLWGKVSYEAELELKLNIVPRFFRGQYIPYLNGAFDEPIASIDESVQQKFLTFYQQVLGGLFFKRYSQHQNSSFLSNKDSRKAVEFSRQDGVYFRDYYSFECPFSIGVLLSSLCNYDASDVMSFVAFYLQKIDYENNEEWCELITEPHYELASSWLRHPLGQGRKRSMRQCYRRLMRVSRI